MTQDADRGRREMVAFNGYLPAAAGVVAGLLLLLAITAQRNLRHEEVTRADTSGSPARQSVVSLPPVKDTPKRVAQRNGSAIAIAHPRTMTMELLAPWVRSLADRGFNLVPVTKLLKRPPPNKLAQLQLAE